MFVYNFAIDLGSFSTIIYKLNLGIVLKERSLVAIEKSGKKKNVVEVGNNASKMLGNSTKDIEVLSPILEGKIADMNFASIMLQNFMKKVEDRRIFKNQSLIFCVPCGLTFEEKILFKNLGYTINARNVLLIPSVVLTNSHINKFVSKAKLIIDIGGDCTDIAVVNNDTVLVGYTLSIGGRTLNNRIKEYVLERYNIILGDIACEEIKRECATLLPNDIIEIEVNGVDSIEKVVKTLTMQSQEISNIFVSFMADIAEIAEKVVQSCTVEAIQELTETGVYICGESSYINGIERFFKNRLNLSIEIEEHPNSSVILGAGKVLNSPDLITKLVSKYE